MQSLLSYARFCLSVSSASVFEEVLERVTQPNLSSCDITVLHHSSTLLTFFPRISECEENKMSPGNLGIVFGPTLLRPLVSGDVSMVAILESSYQAMLVEFMISHQEQIFGCVPKKRTSLPSVASNSPPGAEPDAADECGASTRERPRSLEVGKRHRLELT